VACAAELKALAPKKPSFKVRSNPAILFLHGAPVDALAVPTAAIACIFPVRSVSPCS
jgi:hypothetical protein